MSSKTPLWALLVAIVMIGALVVAGCGDDTDDNPADPGGGDPGDRDDGLPEVTDETQGVWSYEVVATDCATGAVIEAMSESTVDTLCVGDPFIENEVITDACVTSVTGENSLRIECEESQTAYDCTFAYSFTLDITMGAATVYAAGQMTMTYTGMGCQGVEDTCYDFDITATRIGDAPDGACDAKSGYESVTGWLLGKLPIPR